MSIRLTKPWHDLSVTDPSSLPAQLGVFQLAGSDWRVIYIGYGGGREPFGLRSAIATALELCIQASVVGPTLVRYELTHSYLSRWEELLMLHVHDFGALPPGNPTLDAPRGRLTPSGRAGSQPLPSHSMPTKGD